MTQLQATRSSNVNVLGESELEQVVGGYCHRRRYSYGKHCGGWRKREYHCDKSYEAPEYDYDGGESYESSDSYESADGKQVVNVAVTINVAQNQR